MSQTSLTPITGPSTPNFFGMSRERLRAHVEQMGVPAFRAEQVYSWVYQKHVRTPLEMTNLPLAFREALPGICDLELPETASVHKSPDGNTHKFVIRLADGARVESVSMRTPKRLTFCISSQVGCALKCSFCATGLMGLKRNLKAHEIVAQVVAMGEFHGWQDDRFNIVFMGMGEPLANMDAVTETIRILHDENGLNLGARRLTVSTSGLVPQIRELLDAAQEYGRTIGRRTTLEYTLLGGVNDSVEDADRLASIARSMPSKVNIIPYNPVPGLDWKRPSKEAIDRFVERLLPKAPAVTVRHTQGGDIWAACGQLGGLS